MLDGSTLDSNSNWVCRQIVGRGARVTRICVVPDESREIVDELQRQLSRHPSLVVTLGGLGPTADDLTLAAVAAALGLDLTQDADALRIVRERYNKLEAEGVVGAPQSDESVTAREKMSFIPMGSRPLFNPVGAAPAVATVSDHTTILSLPGVPSEVKAIVLNHASEVFEQSIGTGFYRTITIVTNTNDESHLAMPASIIAEAFPDVYIKTRLIRGNSEGRIGITISCGGSKLSTVYERLKAAHEQLEETLNRSGVRIIEAAEDV